MIKSIGFNKLKGLASAGALGIAGMLGVGGNRGGSSISGTLSLTADNVVWRFNNEDSFPTSGTVITTGGAIYSVSQSAYCVVEAIVFDSLAAYSNAFAFDSALILGVDGNLFFNPDSTVILDGNTVTSDVVTDIIPGVDAQIQYRIFTDRKVVRGLFTMTNTTPNSISLNAAILGGFGANESDINIVATSDADTSIDNSDLWFVTDEDTAQGGDDPVITTTRHGVDAEVVPTNALTPINDGAVYGLRYQLNIATGETVRVMVFHELGLPNLVDITNQVAKAADFESMTSLDAAGLINDLNDSVRDTIVNYGDSNFIDDIFKDGFESN